MPRRRQAQFYYRELEDLVRQALFLPSPSRQEQTRRAELLHDQIDPNQKYPLDFVLFRVTGEMPVTSSSVVFEGGKLREDLRCFIDRVSRSAPLPVNDTDPAETVPMLAARLNVSTKTVWRYRDLGMRWRWIQSPGGAPQVAFQPAAVDLFLQAHGQRVERAAKFSLLTPEQKQRIIERARRILSRRDASLNQIARHLAKRTGRAVQTIRQVLDQHDQQNPRQRLFVNRTGPLDAHARRVIARAFRMRVPLAKIARRYKRTRSTIYRAINEERAAALRRMRIDYAFSPLFARPDADELIVWPGAEALDAATSDGEAPALTNGDYDLPQPLADFYRRQPLEPTFTRTLLVQMNYLKYRAVQWRDRLDRYEPRVSQIEHIERDLALAQAIRTKLFHAHLPVVLTTALRHLTSAEHGRANLVELLELGHRVLLEAIDTFDLTKSQTFDAYLTWNLMKRYAELGPPPVRAQRRLSGEEIVARMRQQLETLGIKLD